MTSLYVRSNVLGFCTVLDTKNEKSIIKKCYCMQYNTKEGTLNLD